MKMLLWFGGSVGEIFWMEFEEGGGAVYWYMEVYDFGIEYNCCSISRQLLKAFVLVGHGYSYV